jgi:hypothetical protein
MGGTVGHGAAGGVGSDGAVLGPRGQVLQVEAQVVLPKRGKIKIKIKSN